MKPGQWRVLPWVFLAALFLGELAQAAPLGEGQAFPPLDLRRPRASTDLKYLGLGAGGAGFRLEQIKAQFVLVDVFSLYCAICQVDAPRMNQLHEMIRARGLEGRLKVLGLGAGNTEFEVGAFRDKHKSAFPLLPDPGFHAYKALGEPRTPWLLLVKLGGGGQPVILHAPLGLMGEPAQFLELLLGKAGLK